VIAMLSWIYRHDCDWLAIPSLAAGCAAYVATAVRNAYHRDHQDPPR
jgi:hypothetical protein